MNKNLESEFHAIPTIALNRTFIHFRKLRKSEISSISSLGSLHPVPHKTNKNPESEIHPH